MLLDFRLHLDKYKLAFAISYTAQEVGLFGELHFLRDVCLARLPPLDAVRSWRGGLQDEQDFSLGQWKVEVKTQLSTADRVFKISSAEQLDAGNSKLALCHQTLGVVGTDDPSGSSLRALVSELASVIGQGPSGAVDLFQAILMGYPYVDSEEYAEPCWTLTGRQLFEVRGDFPRLVPSMLPSGISRARYEIDVAACSPFELPAEVALAGMFESDG
jgi:hypothetical protein